MLFATVGANNLVTVALDGKVAVAMWTTEQNAFDSVGKNAILQTVSRYNAVICSAPPKIYEMYVSLYIECCTYEAAAEALCYSVNYVYKTNKKIVDFFFNAMNKEAA